MNVRAFLVNITADATRGRPTGVARMLGVEPTMVAETPFALVGPSGEAGARTCSSGASDGASRT